jgi:predicted Fe-S protein YdhL (DUF1289 family)
MPLSPAIQIESPCVRNCCLNDADICLGCGRSLREITLWSTANNTDKLAILTAAEARKQLIHLRQSTPS